MADYRSLFEGKYMGAWNLIDEQGNRHDMTLTIAKVEAGKIVGEGGKEAKKPLIHFQAKGDYQPLPMVAGKTVAKVIASLYTNETRNWVGKRITLYPTTTSVGGVEKDCIRVRPTIPPDQSVDRGKKAAE